VPWTSSTTGVGGSVAKPLQTGSRLGPYEVDGLIASGGMGDVYRARDTRLDRNVALKVLAPSVTADADRLARFAQEARTTALLNHPNIVAVYDVGADAGIPFVVSELLRGETLRARMKDGALPVGVAVTYAAEVARGLVAAHRLGVVHRDLKPENIFITEDERVKILDFGLAKCRNETLGLSEQDSSVSTQPGTILGTVGYMSPEQVRGTCTDERSDIFSLGVILHEMISGVAPFLGNSAIETLYAILKTDAPALPRRDGISRELEHVVRHSLEKSPDARFQSARDLVWVLELVLRSPAPPQPRTRPARRLLQSILELVF
jgi:eukaryotic-like serine/threonine-protein kinase